ncbi:MAG TPA: cation:proton antiporter [Candidatus Nanoarchaeia archaeon]|nr:cation:proton antiporter [Candidatus Nanoarchaeia archaeon]
MASPYLSLLTSLAFILLIGLLFSMVSKRLRIPDVLLLILFGIGLNHLYYNGSKLISFSPLFITSIGILALIMIVFDSTSRFTLKAFDALALQALSVAGFFLFFNLVLLTLSTLFIAEMPLDLRSVFLALIFAAIMSGTDPGSVFALFKEKSNRIIELLKVEAILNTPFMVLLPFIFLDLLNSIERDVLSTFLEQIVPFLTQFVTGIGAGILIGLIIFKAMRREYSEVFSPLALFIAALLAYVLAENLGGNGVLAVTTLGLFFGNVYLKEKTELTKFSSELTYALEILVYVLIGFVIDLPLDGRFFLISSVLFLIYLIIRLLAVNAALPRGVYRIGEKLFMSLNASKGIATAVIVLLLAALPVPGIALITHLIVAFMLYSLLLSSILIRFSGTFVRSVSIQKKKGS